MRSKTITPNAWRLRRKELREAKANIVQVRREALEAIRLAKASEMNEWGIMIAREEARGRYIEARWRYQSAVSRTTGCTVEVGAAWCPNALARVQAANRSR